MESVFEYIVNGVEFGEQYINGFTFPIPEKCSELVFVVFLLGVDGLQHPGVFFTVLIGEQCEFVFLMPTAFDGLIELFWFILQPFDQFAYLCFLDGSPRVILNDYFGAEWLDY